MEVSDNVNFKARPIKRKPVEVTVFEDPSRRSGLKKARRLKQSLKKNNTRDEEDFNAIFRDVKDFGATGFSKKEKKKFEEQKVQALGARKPKNQKVPYPILQYATKVRKQREEEKKELEKEMGIFSKKKKDKKNRLSTKQSIWWINQPVKIDSSKNNIRIGQSDLLKIGKTKR